MPFFAGLASGFNDALTQNRQLMAQQQEQQAQRDTSVLTLIAQQHSDPRVRAQALSTLAQGVLTPAKGGLMKLFGSGQDRNPGLTDFFHSIARGGGDQQVTAEPATTGTTVAPGAMAQPAAALTQPGARPDAGTVTLPTEAPITGTGSSVPSVGAPVQSRDEFGRPAAAPAATPPPGASASLGIPQSMPNQDRPAITKPVPSPPGGLMLPGEAEMRGRLAAVGGLEGMDPSMRQVVGASLLGIPTRDSYDQQGNRHTFIGTQEIGAPALGVGKAAGPELQVQTQARDLFATGKYSTFADAMTAARTGAATALQSTQAAAALRPEGLRQRIANEVAQLPGIAASAELKQRTLNGQLTQEEASRIAATLLTNRPGATSDDFNAYVTALTSSGTAGSASAVGSSRVDLQACKLEYSIVSPK